LTRSEPPEGASLELRRAPHVILYWRGDTLVLHDFARGTTIPADPLVVQLLSRFSDWTPPARFVDQVPEPARTAARQLVSRLHEDGWLRRRDQEHAGGFDAWAGWNPAAGFFHASTRNTTFKPLDEGIEELSKQARHDPMPPPVKRYHDAEQIGLPAPAARGTLPQTLRARRTWRRFGRRPVPLEDLSTLLHLTAGVQEWVTAKGEGRVALKTSPSGGARHPIELYVLARNVRGLHSGVYHYAADAHALERLPGSTEPPAFDTVLPTQWWYRDAAAVLLMTAVFERTRWRYKTARAYRAVLIEAGHVCQTFCLAATWLKLAPFCSMAIADTAAEELLGIDGISESVIYAAGVGTRPVLGGRLPGALPGNGRERR
jgi:SagB-type dehydrogenase family enzyme